MSLLDQFSLEIIELSVRDMKDGDLYTSPVAALQTGPIAVTPVLGTEWYTVSHVLSGLRISNHKMRLSEALRCARAIADLDVPWDVQTQEEMAETWTKEQRKLVMATVRKFMPEGIYINI